MIEVRVQLKICESCGCLWVRSLAQHNIYCKDCERKLRDFPEPSTRKRRGRPARTVLPRLLGVAEAMGGAL